MKGVQIINKLWEHFKAVATHKLAITKLCFRHGLYKQGLPHDLSKYIPVEFCAGVEYFQGNRSPIDYEKEVKDCSLGWLYRKGRNKHHWECWLNNAVSGIRPVKMLLHYIMEMYCDRAATSRIHMKGNCHDGSTYEYLMDGYDNVIMHEETKAVLKMILEYQRDHGTDTTVGFIRKGILKN